MNQLKAGAVLNYIVIFLNILVGLLYTPYMLRIMGQSEFGLYSLVASVISYLTILDLGLGNAVIRYTAKYRTEGKQNELYEMFGMFFLLYFIIGIIALIIGMILYYNVDMLFGETMTYIELSRARIMMLILVLNLAFTFPMSIFGSIMTAYECFVFPRILNIFRIILNTIIMIMLLHYGYRAIAMIVVQTIFNVVTLIINFLYCKYCIYIKLYFQRFNWLLLKDIAVYSFWILLNVIMDKVYWSTGQFVLGAVSGTIAVSVFAIAIQLEGMYMTFSTAISSVFLPKVTGMVTLNDNHFQISNLFIRTGRIQNFVMFAILMGFVVFGKQFIILWAGVDYTNAYYMTLMFLIALYIPLIQNLGIIILQARNQLKFRSILYIIIASIALIAEVIFAKKWGGIGCSIAIAGALLIGQGFIMNVYYKKYQDINISKFWKEILTMDIAPFLLSLIAYYVFNEMYQCYTWLELIISIVLYGAFYIFMGYKYSLNTEEKKLFLIPIRKFLNR